MKTLLERFEEKYIPIPESGCWIWTSETTNSEYKYGRFWLNRKQQMAHRVSYELFNGPIPDGMLVCHKCDTPECVNPSHLFLGTMKDNMRDMIKKGRSDKNKLSGEAHPKTSITRYDALEIRSSCLSSKQLSKKYGISTSTVNNIRSKKTWKHV